jgi:hypothetical protein
MESKNIPTMDQLERKLLGWEKWLYACFAAAFVLLAHAFVKANEDTVLSEALFFIEGKAGITNAYPPGAPELSNYYYNLATVSFSPGQFGIWLAIELFALVSAAVLSFHPIYRRSAPAKWIGLIFGYLLAGWVALLFFGVRSPHDVSNEYNWLIVIYLLTLGFGYWFLRRKKEKAEEVFP